MNLKQIRNSKGLNMRALSELVDALGITLDELCRNEAAE